MTEALDRAGFSGIDFRAHPGVTVFMWEQSRVITRASCADDRGMRNWLLASRPGMIAAELYEALSAEKREFLTCVAFRAERGGRASA